MNIDKRTTRIFAVIAGVLGFALYGFFTVLGFGIGMIDFSALGRGGLIVLMLIGIALIVTFLHDLVASILWWGVSIAMLVYLVLFPIFFPFRIFGFLLCTYSFGLGFLFLFGWISDRKSKRESTIALES